MTRVFLAFRDAALRFSKDGCSFLSQAIAFNALFAIFPLVVLAFTALSYISLPESRLLGFFDTFAPALHDYLAANLQSYVYGRGITGIVAIVILFWSGKNLFTTLGYALNKIVDVPRGRPIYHDLLLSLIMLPVMGILLILAMLFPIILAIVLTVAGVADRHQFVHLSGYGVSFLLIFIVCITIYSFLPNRKLPWHFGIPGALFAACVWPAMQFAFTLYTVHVDFTRIYGALTAPFVILLWFYFMSTLVLFGGELCTAWAQLAGTLQAPGNVTTKP
jgi:membrane protein